MANGGRVRIVALGNQDRGDDGAALLVAARFRAEASVVLAGRPGSGLLELLPPDQDCILLDVTSSGAPAGTLHQILLDELSPASLPDSRVSSHGFGPGEALALARTLGRQLPKGYFIGIEGGCYELGTGLSPAVEGAMTLFEERVRQALGWLKWTATREITRTPS
ncbi:MAG: hydrogenase maturation protease [Gemmatimonadota bacterium]